MRKYLSLILLGLVSAVAAFLLVQNIFLKKKLDVLTKKEQDAKAAKSATETRPANPPGASPFDKPNVDPRANDFSDSVDMSKLTSIKFDRTTHDFGKINAGDVVHTTFKFTNTGNVALYILHAQGSCGCTVPSWPKDPIKPGDSGEIEVQFDSHGKKGEADKTVLVSSNTTPALNTLTIKSFVISRDN